MSLTRTVAWLAFAGFLALTPAAGQEVGSGMLDPGDRSARCAVLLLRASDRCDRRLAAPAASEVTPEGYICTGFGELLFFVGNPAERSTVRHRTLRDGHLPIVEYQMGQHGVRYRFTLFASDLGGPLTGLPVNFAQVEVVNEAAEQRAAFFSTAYRFSPPSTHVAGPGDYRFSPRFDLIPACLTKDQTSYRQAWIYAFRKDVFTRDGRLLYQFPTNPPPQLAALALNEYGIRAVRFLSGKVLEYPSKSQGHSPQQPMGLVMYRLVLQPNQRRQLSSRCPSCRCLPTAPRRSCFARPTPKRRSARSLHTGRAGSARTIRSACPKPRFKITFWPIR